MSIIAVIDNTPNQIFSLSERGNDCKNLRKIANKTIGELQSESTILIFPPKVEETSDRIKDSVIFNLKEDEENFSLDTGNIMGFIGRNDTTVNICSRFTHRQNGTISEKNDFFLHYMLEKVCHVNLTTLKNTASLDTVFDFLPYFFPHYLIAVLKQGLYKEYQAHEYNDSHIRGVIDISRHIRFNIPANGKIAYRTREYSFDNPVTELIRHTIEYIRASDTFRHILTENEETKEAVSKIDAATTSYARAKRNIVLSKTAKPIKSPYFSNYRDLQKLCRMILLREKIKYDASKNKVYGILFDGAWLWEEYLATIVKPLGFVHPENKKGTGMIHPFENTTVGSFYPDFYRPKPCSTENQKTADIILDAKYKDFNAHNPLADDLSQMISYIHVMDAEEGKFIYPSREKETEETPPNWTLKPFNGKPAKLGTLPFFIPQDAENPKDFKTNIEKSEAWLGKKIL